jgi:GGDEF domain-containing protein
MVQQHHARRAANVVAGDHGIMFRLWVPSQIVVPGPRGQDAIGQRVRAEEIANCDPLSGLTNRRGFVGKPDEMSERSRRHMALILLDLDGFKPINDTFGHPIGDQILIEVSRRLRDLGSGELVVARLGGDEFAAAQVRNRGSGGASGTTSRSKGERRL